MSSYLWDRTLGIVAIEISFLMISCEFDLSVGSIFGFSVYIMIDLVDLANHGISPLFALIISLIVCAFIGAINGYFVVYIRIPSFIVTLASHMFWKGILLYFTEGFPLYYSADTSILEYLRSRIFYGIGNSKNLKK